MKITFEELRTIKHRLPTGGVKQIADALGIQEQTVRNYFGANKYHEGEVVNKHIEPGPGGGVVELERTDILEMAKKLISEATVS